MVWYRVCRRCFRQSQDLPWQSSCRRPSRDAGCRRRGRGRRICGSYEKQKPESWKEQVSVRCWRCGGWCGKRWRISIVDPNRCQEAAVATELVSGCGSPCLWPLVWKAAWHKFWMHPGFWHRLASRYWGFVTVLTSSTSFLLGGWMSFPSTVEALVGKSSVPRLSSPFSWWLSVIASTLAWHCFFHNMASSPWQTWVCRLDSPSTASAGSCGRVSHLFRWLLLPKLWFLCMGFQCRSEGPKRQLLPLGFYRWHHREWIWLTASRSRGLCFRFGLDYIDDLRHSKTGPHLWGRDGDRFRSWRISEHRQRARRARTTGQESLLSCSVGFTFGQLSPCQGTFRPAG